MGNNNDFFILKAVLDVFMGNYCCNQPDKFRMMMK